MERLSEDRKNYEVAMLLREEGALGEVARLLAERGIEVRETGQPRKIALAYPIARVSQAYFSFFYVSAFPHDIKALEQNIRGLAAVLRSLIIIVPEMRRDAREETQKARPSIYGERSRTMPRRPVGTGETRPAPRKALSNEAIEKKIEEILQ